MSPAILMGYRQSLCQMPVLMLFEKISIFHKFHELKSKNVNIRVVLRQYYYRMFQVIKYLQHLILSSLPANMVCLTNHSWLVIHYCFSIPYAGSWIKAAAAETPNCLNNPIPRVEWEFHLNQLADEEMRHPVGKLWSWYQTRSISVPTQSQFKATRTLVESKQVSSAERRISRSISFWMIVSWVYKEVSMGVS